MKIIKKNIKLIIGFILGAVIFGSIGVYAISVASKDVSYDGEKSNVQDAIDDLYSKVNNNHGGPTIDIYSAAEDVIYYYEENKKVPICFTDINGKCSCALPNKKSLTLYSSVAKDPNNLSNPYSKEVTITNSIEDIYLIPEGAIYWYGNTCNWITGGYDNPGIYAYPGQYNILGGLTFGTNQINLTKDASNRNGIKIAGTVNKIDISKRTNLHYIWSLSPNVVTVNIETHHSISPCYIELDAETYSNRYNQTRISFSNINKNNFNVNTVHTVLDDVSRLECSFSAIWLD